MSVPTSDPLLPDPLLPRMRDRLAGALRVYFVVGPQDTAGRPVADVVAAALDGGATMIQIRGKGLPQDDLLALVHAVAPVLEGRGRRPPVILDDAIDVAARARALGLPIDGVHIGQGDASPERARAVLGPDAVIGLSTCPDEPQGGDAGSAAVIAASVANARAADPGLVDYLGIGPLHRTPSKDDAPPVALEADGFGRICRAGLLPAVAIGGVTAGDAPAIRAAGGAGLSVISAISAAPDPRAAARALRTAWDDVGSALDDPTFDGPTTGGR